MNSHKLIIILLLTLLFTGAVLLLKFGAIKSPFLSEDTKTCPSTTPDSIAKAINYKVPQKWKKEVRGQATNEFIKIFSPESTSDNSIDSFGFPTGSEVKITIIRDKNSKFGRKLLEQSLNPKHMQKTTSSDIQKININGCPAASYHFDLGKAHKLAYVIVQEDDTLWLIDIITSSLQIENKYKSDIDYIVNSIQLKN